MENTPQRVTIDQLISSLDEEHIQNAVIKAIKAFRDLNQHAQSRVSNPGALPVDESGYKSLWRGVARGTYQSNSHLRYNLICEYEKQTGKEANKDFQVDQPDADKWQSYF